MSERLENFATPAPPAPETVFTGEKWRAAQPAEPRKPVKGWIQTFTGRMFFLENPSPSEVRIEDIAHALALLCRFTGHCRGHYSVAQHSVLVAEQCPPALKLAGLLHDAAEAYVGDVAKPLKELLPALKEIEHQVQAAVATAFGFHATAFHDAAVNHADLVLLATEKRDLMSPEPWPWHPLPPPLRQSIEVWSAETAEALFLQAFHEFKTH